MVTSPVSLSSRRFSGIWCEPLPDVRPSSIGVRVGWAKPLNPISLPLGQPGEFEGASSDQVAATRHQGRHAACPTQEGIHESAAKCSSQRVILSASQSGLSLPSHDPSPETSDGSVPEPPNREWMLVRQVPLCRRGSSGPAVWPIRIRLSSVATQITYRPGGQQHAISPKPHRAPRSTPLGASVFHRWAPSQSEASITRKSYGAS